MFSIILPIWAYLTNIAVRCVCRSVQYRVIIWVVSVVHFLTRTFGNVFYIRVGKCYVRFCRSQCLQTVVWAGLRWDGSWKTLTTATAGAGATPTGAGATDTPPACKQNPILNQWPLRALFCLKLDNSCWYARCNCQQLQHCHQTRARVQVFYAFYFRSSETVCRFLGKRTVTTEHSQ